jgi:hypothetical protein
MQHYVWVLNLIFNAIGKRGKVAIIFHYIMALLIKKHKDIINYTKWNKS